MALRTPEFLQTKTYSAMRDRLALQHGGGIQPGTWDMGDFVVSQRVSSANMSVDVSAGYALVAANDPGNAGFYHAQNDASLNVSTLTNGSAWPVASSTNPRIDRVVLLVNDTTDGGDVSDTPILGVVQGTATAGATLDNLTGAASVPTGALLLADVLMPAGATTVTTANIRDRRTSARQGWFKILSANAAGAVIGFNGLTLWGGVDHVRVVGRVRSSRAGFASTGFRFSVNAIGTGYFHASDVSVAGTPAATGVQTGAFIGSIPAANSDNLGTFEIEIPYINRIGTINKQFSTVCTSWISAGSLFANNRSGGVLPAAFTSQRLTDLVLADDVGGALDVNSHAEFWVFGG